MSKKALITGLILSLLIVGEGIGFGSTVVEISFNGSYSEELFKGYAYLYRKEERGYVSMGKKYPVSRDGRVMVDVPPGEKGLVLRIYIRGGLTPIYSPPLRAGGIQRWDIKVARVRVLKGGLPARDLVGKEVYLYRLKERGVTNLWRKVRILKGAFFDMPIEPEKGTLIAGIREGNKVLYSDPLKAGQQVWDVTGNHPPRLILPSGKTEVKTGGRLLIRVSSFDLDGEVPELGVEEVPDFVLFRDWGDGTGAILLRPVRGDEGIYRITVTASDGKGSVKAPLQVVVKKGKGQRVSEPPGRRTYPVIDTLPGSALTAVWVNSGEDKVTKRDLRKTRGMDVRNRLWDGKGVRLSGARNEVIAFNLILEAGEKTVKGIRVIFDRLINDRGEGIFSKKVSKNEVFNYVGRNIELFYVRYLQIRGLSRLSYDPTYDERHIPKRLRLPYSILGRWSKGRFSQRPDAYRFYPDIAVPIEAVGAFDIPRGENQSIWVDIYIPKGLSPDTYRGEIKIYEGEKNTVKIPVTLKVWPFTLPDEPYAKTMVFFDRENVNDRYLGKKWPDFSREGKVAKELFLKVWKNHHLLAHRHRVSLIDEGTTRPSDMDMWLDVLTGRLFTPENGYDGPGVGVSSGVYSIGTYGSWRHMWDPESREAMWKHTDEWVEWFEKKGLSNVEYFLYLIDEPKRKDFQKVERWARWVKENPGPGKRLKTLVTTFVPKINRFMPSVDIGFIGALGPYDWAKEIKAFEETGKILFGYNGKRPWTGSFAIEDEGVSLRALAWIQYKHRVQRWFYWEATLYRNPTHRAMETNVFRQAWTFGRRDQIDPRYGETGYNYNNGDGVLFYPGIDRRYPEDSYGIPGPIASLRLKLWRRGIQDVDYLVMASKVDPEAVEELVNRMVPRVLWELGVDDPKDPTYVHADISWPTDPDEWERAREELARIIVRGKGWQR